MSLVKQILGVLVLALIMFAAGYYAGAGQVEVHEVTKTVQSDAKTEIQYRDHIVTVTKTVRPDGTVTETTKTEEKQKETTSETTRTASSTEKDVTPGLSRFSLGTGLSRDSTLSSITNTQLGNYYMSAGMRVFGPGWVETQYSPGLHEVRLGVRLEF